MANTKTTAKAKTKVDEPVNEVVDGAVATQTETQVVKTIPTQPAPVVPENR